MALYVGRVSIWQIQVGSRDDVSQSVSVSCDTFAQLFPSQSRRELADALEGVIGVSLTNELAPRLRLSSKLLLLARVWE